MRDYEEEPGDQYLAIAYSFARLSSVTSEERERMNWLVLRIQQEKDHKTFTQLVEELIKLIDQKERRFPPDSSRQS